MSKSYLVNNGKIRQFLILPTTRQILHENPDSWTYNMVLQRGSKAGILRSCLVVNLGVFSLSVLDIQKITTGPKLWGRRDSHKLGVRYFLRKHNAVSRSSPVLRSSIIKLEEEPESNIQTAVL